MTDIWLTAVKSLLPKPRGIVDSIEFSGRWIQHGNSIRLERGMHQRINDAIDAVAADETREHIGDLREIDLDQRTFILRNITGDPDGEIRCKFAPELQETAKEALDRQVKISGSRPVDPTRRRHDAFAVTRLEILEGDNPSA